MKSKVRTSLISNLVNSNGEWLEHQQDLKNLSIDHFPIALSEGIVKDMNEGLSSLHYMEESQNWFFCVDKDNFPGLDGWLSSCIISAWEIIKEDSHITQYYFSSMQDGTRSVNSSLVHLIRKKQSPLITNFSLLVSATVYKFPTKALSAICINFKPINQNIFYM